MAVLNDIFGVAEYLHCNKVSTRYGYSRRAAQQEVLRILTVHIFLPGRVVAPYRQIRKSLVTLIYTPVYTPTDHLGIPKTKKERILYLSYVWGNRPLDYSESTKTDPWM